jgi:CheY-like chemotaxis protein
MGQRLDEDGHISTGCRDSGHRLPIVDGLEVARRVPAVGARKPLLITLTGYGAPEFKKRCDEAGFDLHLVKPADPQRLQAALCQHRQALGLAD